MWEKLPDDMVEIILSFHNMNIEEKVILIQKNWKGFKVRCLLRSFNQMIYLQEFRRWNPSLREYYQRTSRNDCCMY